MTKKERKHKDKNGPAGIVVVLGPLDRANLKEIQAKCERVGCHKKVSEIISDAARIGINELLK